MLPLLLPDVVADPPKSEAELVVAPAGDAKLKPPVVAAPADGVKLKPPVDCGAAAPAGEAKLKPVPWGALLVAAVFPVKRAAAL